MLQSADPVASDSRQGGPSRITGTHRSGPPSSRANEAAALPSLRVMLSRRSERYYGRLRLPPGRHLLPGSTPVIRRRCPRLSAARFGRGGSPQFPPPPSERSAPSYAGESLTAALQDLRRFHGLRREPPGSALSSVSNDAAGFASATDRSVAPPEGLSTLGSSPARFQARPPACYRAPWRLPGPDFHRQATTSFRSGHDRWTITSMISGRTGCSTNGALPQPAKSCSLWLR